MRLDEVRAGVKAFALGLPEAWEDHPWGEDVGKVGKKVFAFLGVGGGDVFHLTVKLPSSRDEALSMPFATPAGYGLDRGGWVTLTCRRDEVPPLEVLTAWVEESYRAVAPRRLIAQLDSG